MGFVDHDGHACLGAPLVPMMWTGTDAPWSTRRRFTDHHDRDHGCAFGGTDVTTDRVIVAEGGRRRLTVRPCAVGRPSPPAEGQSKPAMALHHDRLPTNSGIARSRALIRSLDWRCRRRRSPTTLVPRARPPLTAPIEIRRMQHRTRR
jgi:hypothetical protein